MRGADHRLPVPGMAFLSVRDADKEKLVPVAKHLLERGYSLVATSGSCDYLRGQGLYCQAVNKVTEGRPHIVDMMKNGEISYIVNTTEGGTAIADSFSIRREALQRRISYSTTIAGAHAVLSALDHEKITDVRSLQELHKT
jgi:carbamoyl-phosphate synthase large subunit